MKIWSLGVQSQLGPMTTQLEFLQAPGLGSGIRKWALVESQGKSS